MSRAPLLAVVLAGFALRVHAIGDVPLRWDEGWSVALACLPVAEIVRLTALDVHPPLYYLTLAPWLGPGAGPAAWPRLLSALVGTLAIPLACVAASAWWRGGGSSARRAGLAAAVATAVAPALLYYAGVARMYAATAPLLLLACVGLVRHANGGRARWALAAWLGATGALHAFYYTAFALAGLFAAALLAHPRRWRRIGAVWVATAATYLPWLAYAAPLMADRTTARTGPGGLDPRPALRLLDEGLAAATLASADLGDRSVALGVAVLGALLVLGAVAAGGGTEDRSVRRSGRVPEPRSDRGPTPPSGRLLGPPDGGLPSPQAGRLLGRLSARRTSPRTGHRPATFVGRLAVVILPALVALLGAGLGAQAHMFAVRYAIPATPFLALGVGWAVSELARWRLAAGLLAGALALAAVLPQVAGPVYLRAAEVSGDYDPAADAVSLRGRAGPTDAVAFNVLSLAGAYEVHRRPGDAPWTYAQVWDPVREDAGLAIERVEAASARARALWLVLYRGTASPGSAAVHEWADSHLFPADGWWTEDRLYQAYATGRLDGSGRGGVLGGAARLVGARYTKRTSPGGAVSVSLDWQRVGDPPGDARVFVHLYGPDGALVAQHDAGPAFDTRPITGWQPGETIHDRHGLLLPAEAHGPLRLVVGMYDPATGTRWRGEDGRDGVEVGPVEVGPVEPAVAPGAR